MQSLMFLGDIFIKDDNYKIDIDRDYICNLEYVPRGSDYKPITGKINLMGTDDFSGFTKKPLAVSLANNHILDFTEKGYEKTIALLKDNNIKYFGAGTAENNYNNPCYITKDNKKIALLGYCDIVPLLCEETTKYSVSDVNFDRIENDIKKCREAQADYIVVNIHWGREERPLNTNRQQKLGRNLIDMGVDLVIGHHPHCIQPYEVYKGKYIFYSLGNFFFNNIAMPSYFDEKGNPEFVMYKKHMSYGRKSLAVTYDFTEKSKETVSIMLTKSNEYDVKFIKEVKGNVIPRIYKNKFINEIVGFSRMFALLIGGNLFTGNEIVNVKAFKKEFSFLKKRFTKK